MRKIGITSTALKHTDECFEEFRASGLSAIEVNMGASADLDVKMLADLAKRHDVTLWSCHLPYVPFDMRDISLEDSRIRNELIKFLGEKIKKGAEVGIDKFVVHPSTPIPETANRDERKKYAMDSLAKLARIAASCGAVIAAEDMIPSCLGNCADELLEMISIDDRIRVCFDVNHILNDSHVDFVKKVSDKIVTMHISDYDFEWERHWFPGNGKINWPELYSAVCDAGYEGAWIYELGLNSTSPNGGTFHGTFNDFYENALTIFSGKQPPEKY